MSMPFQRRAGWQKTIPSNVSSWDESVKSLVMRTNLRMNGFYAREPFPLLQLPPQLTTVHPHRAAPNLTTTQVTTARCQRPSTSILLQRARSTSQFLSSYRTLTPWCFTTILTSTMSTTYPSRIRGTGILSRLTLLLVGADACTIHIIKSVWGEDDDARLALGSPRWDLSLICQNILPLNKVAINAVYLDHEPRHTCPPTNLRLFSWTTSINTTKIDSRHRPKYCLCAWTSPTRHCCYSTSHHQPLQPNSSRQPALRRKGYPLISWLTTKSRHHWWHDRFRQWNSSGVWYVSSMWTNGILSAGSSYCTIPFHARNCSWSMGGGHTWGDGRGVQFLERHWHVATFEFSF